MATIKNILFEALLAVAVFALIMLMSYGIISGWNYVIEAASDSVTATSSGYGY